MPKPHTPINLFDREVLAANGVESGPSSPTSGGADGTKTKAYHLEVVRLLGTLHKRFLDEIKSELDRLGAKDINNIRTLLLIHIGDESPTIGELMHRGYYFGSNISYNVKKLIENGYLIAEHSVHDKRNTRVHLSDRARLLVELLDPLFEPHGHPIQSGDLDSQMLADVIDKLNMLERFWPRGPGMGEPSSASHT